MYRKSAVVVFVTAAMLVVMLTGCALMTNVGQQVRATIEPPVAKADLLVGLANEKAARINDIATRLSLGQPVTDAEKAELLELSQNVATATAIAKSSTEDALAVIRLLPAPKEK